MKCKILALLIMLLWFWSCTTKQEENKEGYKIELGKRLFFDNKLSYNQTKSCASCHDPKFAFTDSYKRSIGSYGDLHQRNSKPLFNLEGKKYLTAADSSIHTLVQQMDNPLFNDSPKELGCKGKENEILHRFNIDKKYNTLFQKAFPTKNKAITFELIKEAISAFIITIKSKQSKYDEYVAGNKTILNKDEKEGMQLFFSEMLQCSKCHGGDNFDHPSVMNKNGELDFYFNIGLYNIDAKGGYPSRDIGLMYKTNLPNDMGKFRVPTLRNLLYTAPYYHDGSEISLKQVIENYNNGGRVIKNGYEKGNGAESPLKHSFIKPLGLNEMQKNQLLAFLYTLNDSNFVHKKEYQLP
jgi:cytochrome c peroxidase